MYNQNSKDLVYLISCAVNGVVPEDVSKIDLNEIYDISSKHFLSATVSSALQSVGVKDRRIESSIAATQRKAVIMEKEKTALFQLLEKEGIWYIPLKGAVLKDLYPQFWMREMADYDILFDSSRADDVKKIMESLGFATISFDTVSNHDVYYKRPVANFEMHRSLFRDFSFHETDLITSYYADVKDKLIRDRDCCFRYHFSDEDYYIYMVAHEYKHFIRGGTGIRSLLDTYVYLKCFDSLNWTYIKQEVKKLGIEDFEAKNRELAIGLFRDGTVSDEDMLEYMLHSGTFGNRENFIKNNRARSKNMMEYIWRRLFIPMKLVKKSYPVFYRFKILLPFLPLYRMYRVKKKGRSIVNTELKLLKRIR